MHNPFVPETLEGWSALHLMYRIDWGRLRDTSPEARREMAAEMTSALESTTTAPEDGATALVQLLGHKGDLMIIAFRRTFDDLGRTELALSRCALHACFVPTSSYVSIVELGMYEMTAKIHRQLAQAGLTPGTEPYDAAFDKEMEVQRQRVLSRLFAPIPQRRYVCFYPMNKRRGEVNNWYTETYERRAAMMLEHGKVGRDYAGKVTQIISGSIGVDDWEWGVDLFADDPLVFKKLVYEMRFDEASAVYGLFGAFFVGLRFPAGGLASLLSGKAPSLT